MDGVYAGDDNGYPQFQALLAPENEEIQQLAESLAERIPKFLEHHGLGPDRSPEECDPLSRDQPGLATLYAASVSGRVAFGPNAGRRLTRIGDQIDPESMEAFASPRCAGVSGFSLHANTHVDAADRRRLERLVRYCARPAIALERLESLSDGRLRYRFKRPWRDGTTHVVFQPLELLERLCALVPAPRAHLVRYSGILAPASKWRPLVVPTAPGSPPPALVAEKSVSATERARGSGSAEALDAASAPAMPQARNLHMGRIDEACVGVGRFGMPPLPGPDAPYRRNPLSRCGTKNPGLSRTAFSRASGRPAVRKVISAGSS